MGLSQAKMKPIWEAAKKGEAVEVNAISMAQAIKKNKPLTTARQYRYVNCAFKITAREWDRLEKKYVTDGSFTSIGAVCRAILRGEVAEQVKLI